MPLLSCSLQLTVQEVIENTILQVSKAKKRIYPNSNSARFSATVEILSYEVQYLHQNVLIEFTIYEVPKAMPVLLRDECSSMGSLMISMETGKIG